MPHFDEMPTLLQLKNHLLSLFRPKQRSIFNIHDPIGTKIIFQLRLGLSKLRHHKKKHNFVDTPSDLCTCHNGIEDTNHYLFYCRLYATQRAKLASTVIDILSPQNLAHLSNNETLYLYGDENLSSSENRDILLATIEYIKETNRFT